MVQVRVATRWRARQVTGTPLSSGRAGTVTKSTDGTGPARTPSGRPWNCREAAGTPPGQEQRKRRLRSTGPPSTEHCGAPGGRSATDKKKKRPFSLSPSIFPYPASLYAGCFTPTGSTRPLFLDSSTLLSGPPLCDSLPFTDRTSEPRRLASSFSFKPRSAI